MVRARWVYAIGFSVAFAFGIALFFLIRDHRREIQSWEEVNDECLALMYETGGLLQDCVGELLTCRDPEIGL